MVNYKCIRCGYTTKDKSKIKTHFKRKTSCKPLLNDINLDEYKNDILNGKKIILEKTEKMNPKMIQKMEQNGSMNPKGSKKKNYKCNYCEKSYSTNSNLNKHKKYRCKEKVKDDECKKNMMELVKQLNDQLKEQLKAKDKQIEELIKKAGITTNIQNNIKVLAYKNTDLSHLTDKDYMYCLNRSNFCVPHLIKRIHFNSKKPENHNVYISNIKNKYIMVYDGKKWKLRDRDETIDDLIDKNEFILEQKLEEWIENGKDYPIIMKKFNRYLEKKEKNDVINKIKQEIKLILFNNRKIISSI